MRLTDFWARMDDALGPAYAASWARDHHVAGLGGRTVEQALADAEDTLTVWRAVHQELGLPARDR